mmetsp:Transcript_362/g.1059  ORF Transcript_362/g.1059 Transcript_362/m.1059 type:complete len:231 (-) Transcript_362:548-1240(-)
MTLYIKAGPDGESVGDCPFAHYVRTVLHEKDLEYSLVPSTQSTKPQWLIDFYEGKMPALRHRRECYVESDVIAQYLDFFFQEPEMSGPTKKAQREAGEACDGFFPAVARYLKHTPDNDAEDVELRENLEEVLGKLEEHLGRDDRAGPYLAGDGETFTLVDASLAPKLLHMEVGLRNFKKGDGGGAMDDMVREKFPMVRAYMDAVFERPSFMEASYPEETILWGWGNARGD